jgi:hypothetical protein
MSVALKLLIEKTEAAVAAATTPVKKARLERDLASYKYTAAKAEGGDDDDPDDDGPDDDDKTAKATKKAALSAKKHEAAGHKAKGDEFRRKAAECDQAAKDAMGAEDGDEDAEATALRGEINARLATSLPEGAAAALASQAGQDAALRGRLDAIEKERAAERKASAIQAALTGGAYGEQPATKGPRITPGEAKTLAAKPDAFVADFLSMRPKAIVNTDETDLLHPNPQEHADLPAASLAEIDKMVASLPNLTDTQRAAVRTNMINGRRAVTAGAPNGAPGRF